MKRIIILFMMVMMLSSFASAQMDIVEVRESGFLESLAGGLFAISTDASTYEQGETVYITDVQDINTACTDLSVRIEVENSAGSTVMLAFRDLDDVAYINARVLARLETANLAKGDYVISTRWTCDGVVLGKDGYPDSRTEGDTHTFSVVTNIPIYEPPQTCSKSCQNGQELINPDSPDCYCEYTWLRDDGSCDAWEPDWTEDCSIQDEPVDETQPPTIMPSQETLLIGIGLIIVIIGGLMVVMKQ